MKYSIRTVIDELLDNQIITDSVAQEILDHYNHKKDESDGSRMLGIFGVLGALLVGVGLILIVAHNWDDLSRNMKSALSFLPVIIGLAGCGYSLWKQSYSFTWKEGSAVFLTFAFGACVALISQIYNIPGSLQEYMLTWVVAVLPLVYIMESSVTSLFYIIGVTAYGSMAGYDGSDSIFDHFGHWLLLTAIIPFYIRLLNNQPQKNATFFHHWLIPGSAAILLGTLPEQGYWWLLTAYFSLFSLYYLLSGTDRFFSLTLFSNGYRIIGSLGVIGLLLAASFFEWWNSLHTDFNNLSDSLLSYPFFVTIILMAICTWILIKKRQSSALHIMDFGYIAYPLLLMIATTSPVVATILTNLLLLVMAVGTIYKGSQENHLGIVNYGLLTIAALIICRFFDTDIPFVIRGLLFIGVGATFFLVNYQIIRNRKSALKV